MCRGDKLISFVFVMPLCPCQKPLLCFAVNFLLKMKFEEDIRVAGECTFSDIIDEKNLKMKELKASVVPSEIRVKQYYVAATSLKYLCSYMKKLGFDVTLLHSVQIYRNNNVGIMVKFGCCKWFVHSR